MLAEFSANTRQHFPMQSPLSTPLHLSGLDEGEYAESFPWWGCVSIDFFVF